MVTALAPIPSTRGSVAGTKHGASVSSGFPVRQSHGGFPAPPAKSAEAPATPSWTSGQVKYWIPPGQTPHRPSAPPEALRREDNVALLNSLSR